MDIKVAVDCGNSPKMQFLRDFNIAFAQGDTDHLMDSVADDIYWDIVGDKIIQGKPGFEAALQQMKEEKLKGMHIEKVVTHGKTGAVDGRLIRQNGKEYAFCDVYEFQSAKGNRLAVIKSYIIELKP